MNDDLKTNVPVGDAFSSRVKTVLVENRFPSPAQIEGKEKMTAQRETVRYPTPAEAIAALNSREPS